MKGFLTWVWKRGIVSTFVAGILALLPIAITFGIMIWLGDLIHNWIGSGSQIGEFLRDIGFQFVTDELSAYFLGLLILIGFIWIVGFLLKSVVFHQIETTFQDIFSKIPIFGDVYRPVSQVISMFKKDQETDMRGMSVVYCEFGYTNGGGLLGLLSSKKRFQFREQECYAVYIPTSPIPMSGGIIFVPVKNVQKIEMELDDLMQIYFSMGIMSDKVIPEHFIFS